MKIPTDENLKREFKGDNSWNTIFLGFSILFVFFMFFVPTSIPWTPTSGELRSISLAKTTLVIVIISMLYSMRRGQSRLMLEMRRLFRNTTQKNDWESCPNCGYAELNK